MKLTKENEKRLIKLGVDVSLINYNLSLTPWQRMINAEQAINFGMSLRKARLDAELSKNN